MAGSNAGVKASGDRQKQPLPPTTFTKQGGWTTVPFFLATVAGLTLSGGGWLSNLIVYLIQEFNIKSIDAAQINNIILGSTSFIPVIAAIVADSFLGCFSVIWISSIVSLMGLILLVLTVKLDGLRPQPCESITTFCATPSTIQYTVLYTALTLASIGLGGTRFTVATMGANQFTKPKHQTTYFNWYFVTLYIASVVASTGIVYIQDNVSWAWGFGVCIIANVLALAIFLLGSKYYYHDKPQGSPFTTLARVMVASFRKRNARVSFKIEDYYYGDDRDHGEKRVMAEPPTNSFRSLNVAAFKTDGDVLPNGSLVKPWKLCTVQQLEDFKSLIRILPLWSSSVLLATPIGIQAGLSVLQALTMDRRLSTHFQIPAGSILVFTFITTAIFLSLFDHIMWPAWKKIWGKKLTPLQQIGVGHVFNVASMAVSAIVEYKRKSTASSGSLIVPLSVLWLVPQLALVGVGEAFHYPAQVDLYYQEFPTSLKSMGTAMISMLIGTAFYLSSAVIDLVRRVSHWLPDNLNEGRLDYVYWMIAGLGVCNFGYYLVCSSMYKYNNIDISEGDESLVVDN